MKRIFVIITLGIAMALPCIARDKVYHSADALPAAAQQTMKKSFPKARVSRVKVDSNALGIKDYEVILTNGTEIEFDKNGAWTEIDCGYQAVPDMFLLEPIRTYVKKNYKNAFVIKVEKDRDLYEIELSDDTDLEFDRSGRFLKAD